MGDEEDFRACLDARGVLREGAIASPSRDDAFTVFAQRDDAFLDASALTQQARRFFATDLGLTVDKRYELVVDTTSTRPPSRVGQDVPLPRVDAARVVIAANEEHGTRLAYGRPRDDDDLRIADEAEARVGYAGLALLAKRCHAVWLVQVDARGEGDRVALRIAAIFASVLLGPILAPRGASLFGVKTARSRLAI
jgi:hypothetical protein